MQVVICPDKFAGTLSATQAARAIAEGWRSVAPGDELVLRPVSDGGPGFLDVLISPGGELIEVPATDPLGRPVIGRVLLVGETAYVESADATGLHHLASSECDPKATTSRGLAALVVAGARAGARRVVIGLGGSATNDGGAGFLAGLGLYPVNPNGIPLPEGGAWLAECGGLKLALGRIPLSSLAGVELVAASDVDNPLTGPHGASAVFGPQKGATPSDVELLDTALARWAAMVERDLPGCPEGLARLPGGGAAGGIGAAVLALRGKIISGIDLVLGETGLKEEIARAGLVITGEGSFDQQSLRGKVTAGVAGAAGEHGVPCVVLAGRVTTGRREQGAAGVTEAHSLVDHFGSVQRAMAEPERGLRELAQRLARQYSH